MTMRMTEKQLKVAYKVGRAANFGEPTSDFINRITEMPIIWEEHFERNDITPEQKVILNEKAIEGFRDVETYINAHPEEYGGEEEIAKMIENMIPPGWRI
jgi:hypothetical protein